MTETSSGYFGGLSSRSTIFNLAEVVATSTSAKSLFPRGSGSGAEIGFSQPFYQSTSLWKLKRESDCYLTVDD